MRQTSVLDFELQAPAQCVKKKCTVQCHAYKLAKDKQKGRLSVAVMCFCMAVPKQMKPEFCSLLPYQYLILHVITTSILCRVQQLCMFRENRLHTYFSSFVNTGKTQKILFSIRHRQDKGFIGLHCSVNALTIQKLLTTTYIIRPFS